jgi:glutathionyl-hydroquinone reductase
VGEPEFYRGSYREGEFVRPESRFRRWVRADGRGGLAPEPGRYHLYVSLACPWSHRVIILRKLRKLESAVSMSVTDPVWNENGWFFGSAPGAVPDTVNGKRDVIELYRLAEPGFEGEETVPILWDRRERTIVSNESRDIMRMLDVEFRGLGDESVCLCPPGDEKRIDEAIDRIYGPVANGVYQAGFARSQRAYERAVRRLFEALDEWESLLGKRRFVCGEAMTEADIALFVALIRFDAVYYTHFKCNVRRIADYANLQAWLVDLYQTPGIGETCDFFHIKHHYFGSHRELNPLGIVPLGPELQLDRPVDRTLVR